MPILRATETIVGTTILGPTRVQTVARYNASDYSHSTVHVIFATDEASLMSLNAPPLTWFHTPPAECAERWMLAGGQEITTTRRMPPVQDSVTPVVSATPLSIPPELTDIILISNNSATASVASDSLVTDMSPFLITSVASLAARSDFIVQYYTIVSLDLTGTATDPSYRTCQPYSSAPTYSPGMCPFGHTVAQVTAWQISTSTGCRTFWQASCCRKSVTPVLRFLTC